MRDEIRQSQVYINDLVNHLLFSMVVTTKLGVLSAAIYSI